jgi:hypothetical protein
MLYWVLNSWHVVVLKSLKHAALAIRRLWSVAIVCSLETWSFGWSNWHWVLRVWLLYAITDGFIKFVLLSSCRVWNTDGWDWWFVTYIDRLIRSIVFLRWSKLVRWCHRWRSLVEGVYKVQLVVVANHHTWLLNVWSLYAWVSIRVSWEHVIRGRVSESCLLSTVVVCGRDSSALAAAEIGTCIRLRLISDRLVV